jgi:hypothetical protein
MHTLFSAVPLPCEMESHQLKALHFSAQASRLRPKPTSPGALHWPRPTYVYSLAPATGAATASQTAKAAMVAAVLPSIIVVLATTAALIHLISADGGNLIQTSDSGFHDSTYHPNSQFPPIKSPYN